MRLDGAVAIVTGSAGAIGRETALALARAGATPVCTGLDEASLNAVLATVRADAPDAIAVAADVTDRAQVDRVVAAALARFGRIDALVNNAATFAAIGAVHEVDPDAWWREVTTNLLGPFLFSRAVLPHMIERDRGVIVNLSGAGFGSAVPGGSAYACAKTALLRLTETLDAELGARVSRGSIRGIGSDVAVVAIEPPFVASGMTRQMAGDPRSERWLPFIGEALEDPEPDAARKVAAAIREAIAAADARLSGLAWSYDQDPRAIAEAADALRGAGAHQLRLRS